VPHELSGVAGSACHRLSADYNLLMRDRILCLCVFQVHLCAAIKHVLSCRVNGEGHSHTIPSDVRIPLKGLTIDLLDAATKDKSLWIRKVPMRLKFEECILPYSERSFMFFANNASEKEQWCDRCCRLAHQDCAISSLDSRMPQ
jgi:hypothetical protein